MATYRQCVLCDELYPAGGYSVHREGHVPIRKAPKSRSRPDLQRRAFVVAEWRTGRTAVDISQQLGISRERVRQILAAAGVPSARHSRPPRERLCGLCAHTYVGPFADHARAVGHNLGPGPRRGLAPRTQAIAAAYSTGEPVAAIAERFGVTVAAVCNAARRVGVPMRYSGYRATPRERTTQVIEALRSGAPNWLVAEQFGMTTASVSAIRSRYAPLVAA